MYDLLWALKSQIMPTLSPRERVDTVAMASILALQGWIFGMDGMDHVFPSKKLHAHLGVFRCIISLVNMFCYFWLSCLGLSNSWIPHAGFDVVLILVCLPISTYQFANMHSHIYAPTNLNLLNDALDRQTMKGVKQAFCTPCLSAFTWTSTDGHTLHEFAMLQVIGTWKTQASLQDTDVWTNGAGARLGRTASRN